MSNLFSRVVILALIIVLGLVLVVGAWWQTNQFINETRSQLRFQTCLLLVEQDERTRQTVFRCADEAGLDFELIPDPD